MLSVVSLSSESKMMRICAFASADRFFFFPDVFVELADFDTVGVSASWTVCDSVLVRALRIAGSLR